MGKKGLLFSRNVSVVYIFSLLQGIIYIKKYKQAEWKSEKEKLNLGQTPSVFGNFIQENTRM